MKKLVIFLFLFVFLIIFTQISSAAVTWYTTGADTNESIRFNRLVDVDCGAGYLVIGVEDNGTVKCAADSIGAAFGGYDVNLSWENESNIFREDQNFSKGILISNLTNCDTVDTNAEGLLICGTDATGVGGGWTDALTLMLLNNTDFINISHLNQTLDVNNYTAGGNMSISSHVISIDFTELKSWLDNLFQVIGSYVTNTDNIVFYNTSLLNDSYLRVGQNLTSSFDDLTNVVFYNESLLNDSYLRVGQNITFPDDLTNVAFTNGSETFTGNLTVDEYFYGQPTRGGIDGGIIWAAEIDDYGNLNLTHGTGLNLGYPNMTIRIVSTPEGDEKYCNISEAVVSVPDNAHTAYIVNSNCVVANIPVANFVDAVINQAGNTPIFHVMAHDGEIEVHQGIPIQNRIYIRSRLLNFKTINLDVVSGMSLTEENLLNFTINSGEYIFVDNVVDATTQNITKNATLEVFFRDGGTYMYDEYNSGLNLTSCEDASENLITCSNPTKYRRYFIFLTGYVNAGDDTEVHQRLASDATYYNNLADCLNTEVNSITYDLPTIYDFTAVPLYAYCGQTNDASLSEGAFIDLRTVQTGQASGGIDTSVFLTKDGTRALTADWDTGDFTITAGDLNATNWDNLTDSKGLVWGEDQTFNKGILISNLTDCDTVDTNAEGLLICGTDATGANGMDYTNLVLDNDSSTLNQTWDVNNYTAGGNMSISSHVISIDFTELKSWLDNLFQVIGSYVTNTDNIVFYNTSLLNDSYLRVGQNITFPDDLTNVAFTNATETFDEGITIPQDKYINYGKGNQTYNGSCMITKGSTSTFYIC